MNIFNGKKLATKQEKLLKGRIASDFSNKKLKIAAIFFTEDAGSKIYTDLKHEAADRVGIEYEAHKFSLKNILNDVNNEKVIAKIEELNKDKSITGIIIQKPWRKTWAKAQGEDFLELVSQQIAPRKYEREKYGAWWRSLTSKILEKKDVDGLHPNTISQIRNGVWKENHKVLPATCRAVLTIMGKAGKLESISDLDLNLNKKIIIIGKSDLLGIPLYYELLRLTGELKTEEELEKEGMDEKNMSQRVELIANREFRKRMISKQKLLDADVVISATGIKNLITGDMVSDNVVVIDVGEPKPDVEFESVSKKSSFITPVPGGVGPLTVVSLLENCADLAQ